MTRYQVDPAHVIADAAALTHLFEPTHALALQKCQPRLGPHAQDFIRRSPFLCIGTQDREGRADVSPRGDPPGFVRILDECTLAVPDRPGNNRLDSLINLLSNPSVGLLFMVPGFNETLRVNGHATLVTEPGLLSSLSIEGRAPRLAIVVSVTEVFLHCAKAFRRSQLWDVDRHQPRSSMPSLVKMILDDTTGAPEADEMRRLDEALEDAYRKTMY